MNNNAAAESTDTAAHVGEPSCPNCEQSAYRSQFAMTVSLIALVISLSLIALTIWPYTQDVLLDGFRTIADRL